MSGWSAHKSGSMVADPNGFWDHVYLPKQDPNDPEELTRVQLCGQACSDLQMSGEVDVQYRCPDDDSC